jgi:Tfp pilus assembly protein FimT
MQNNNAGFSILEIIIIIALIGVLGSITLPNLFVKRQGDVVKTFIKEFSILYTKAISYAIQTNSVVQVFFDIEKKDIFLKEERKEDSVTDIHENFQELSGNNQGHVRVPDFLDLRGLYIQEFNEMENGKKQSQTRFYVMPNGTAQPVIMNFGYTTDSGLEKKISLQVTPFLGHVQTHEEFTQP